MGSTVLRPAQYLHNLNSCTWNGRLTEQHQCVWVTRITVSTNKKVHTFHQQLCKMSFFVLQVLKNKVLAKPELEDRNGMLRRTLLIQCLNIRYIKQNCASIVYPKYVEGSPPQKSPKRHKSGIIFEHFSAVLIHWNDFNTNGRTIFKFGNGNTGFDKQIYTKFVQPQECLKPIQDFMAGRTVKNYLCSLKDHIPNDTKIIKCAISEHLHPWESVAWVSLVLQLGPKLLLIIPPGGKYV